MRSPALAPSPSAGGHYITAQTSARIALALLLCLLLLSAGVGVYSALWLPPALPADAPPGTFSAGRALQLVQQIARAPHAPASPEHTRVRQYLLQQLSALGLHAEDHPATTLHNMDGTRSVLTLHNYLARFPGSQGGPALAVMAHYDSMSQTPGAADDAAGVAAMLELARALQTGPAPRRDVLLIFTDGEDQGILGARGLAADKALVSQIGLLVNLDSPGRTGPALLFETSSGGSPLVKAYAAATPAPAGYSLASLLYVSFSRIMSCDTDFTPFAAAGVPGLNFAFAYDTSVNHTALDTPETLDARSVQHMGSNALALARNYDGRRADAKAGEEVFLPVPGRMIHYPAAWALPLAVVTAGLACGILMIGVRRRGPTRPGLVAGLAAVVAALLGSVVAASVLWEALMLLRADYRAGVAGSRYEPHLYLLALLGVAIVAVAFAARRAQRRGSSSELAAGGLCIWAFLGLAAVAWAPAASYLFLFPAAGAGAGLGWRLARRSPGEAGGLRPVDALALGLAAVPVILVLAPAAYLLFQIFGLSLKGAPLVPTAGIPVLVVTAGLILLVPQLDALAGFGSRAWGRLGLAIFAACFIAGQIVPGRYLVTAPPVSAASRLFYRLDVSTGQAYWATGTGQKDTAALQFLGAGAREARTSEFFPPVSQGSALLVSAPVVSLPAPEVAVLSDQTIEGGRALRFRARGALGGELLRLAFSPESQVSNVSVNGDVIRPAVLTQFNQAGDWPWLPCLAPPGGGVEVSLVVPAGASLRVYVAERVAGLAPLAGKRISLPPDGADFVYGSKAFDL